MGWLILVILVTPYILMFTVALLALGVSKISSPHFTDDMVNGGVMLFFSCWCFFGLTYLWSLVI